MKNTKTQKGITLVALIITIIVLLILAVVAIRAVQDGGIIQYAKNARTDYQAAQSNEKGFLENYLDYIDEHTQSGGGSEEGGSTEGDGTAEEQTTRAAGIYQAGTTNLIKDWNWLVTENVVKVTDGVLTTYVDLDNGEFSLSAYLTGGDLILPEDVTAIGEYVFTECSVATIESIGSNLLEINSRAFDSYSGSVISLPEGVTTLNSQAFTCANDHGLTAYYLPSTITNIGDGAFDDGNVKIYYSGTEADWNNIDKHTEWFSEYSRYEVHCEDGTVLEYVGSNY